MLGFSEVTKVRIEGEVNVRMSVEVTMLGLSEVTMLDEEVTMLDEEVTMSGMRGWRVKSADVRIRVKSPVRAGEVGGVPVDLKKALLKHNNKFIKTTKWSSHTAPIESGDLLLPRVRGRECSGLLCSD
ncbi:hypothetical protein AVEN_199276-1 [Araneus ventricosus]|uniref:Uncharacterized protein n=1 Tax=Araneus ventricosus TaxID=182803 RepID=A0A4Y2TU70_ARAVE|nr:hypothetical protein AVEN_199276-1 [Araneus ventricosus]